MKRNILILVFLSFSCSSKVQKDKDDKTVIADTILHITKLLRENKITSIDSIEKGSVLDGWTDEGSFWLLTFKPNKVVYEFTPSCSYWFPSKIINNEIVFYWSLNEDCSYGRGLRKTFDNIDKPQIGEPFGRVRMVDDSIIEVEYYFSDWVRKINKQEEESIDTLFPRRFKRIRL